MADVVPYRLPHTVVPHRYELVIEPDLASDRFEGTVTVALETLETVTELVLNASRLTLEDAVVTGADGVPAALEVSYRPDDERVVLTPPTPLSPGPAALFIRFAGPLAHDLRGFYRAAVTGPDGRKVLIAATQCESTDARRVFPCWDEPEFKAVFAVSLIVPEGARALSNAREITNLAERPGYRRVTFADTVPMSTYLVALVVGPFELTSPILVDNVPVRIAARPGFAHLTDFAADAAVATLRFFQNYFGIPYPGDKLDHVAIPEFAAGAMENLGLVTYRENALLVDREHSSPMEQLAVLGTMAHETAHMWFGDLVTMRWWNGIWLNEAFATFMELLAVDALHPEWDVWAVFAAGRAYALGIDGLANTRPIEYPVGPPAEASAMFDALTYQKGAAVLRMLEQYLGPDVFRRGITEYLTRHRYGNTETGDLWDALEAVSGEPVRVMMDSWVFQGGYPLVHAAVAEDGRAITLTQRQFRYQGRHDGVWQVPVVCGIRRSDGGGAAVSALLGREALRVPLEDGWTSVVVNQGGYGFYRVAYDPALWERLMPVIADLTPLERLGLTDDVWAAVLADAVPLPQAVRLWRALKDVPDPDLWSMVFRHLTLLEALADDDERSVVQSLVREVARPLWEGLSWEPPVGENVRQGRLRAVLLRMLGTIGADPSVQAEAKRRFAAHVAQQTTIAPELLTAVAEVVAASGGEPDWHRLHEAFVGASTPQDQTRYLYALANVGDPSLVARTLALYMSSAVRVQDSAGALGWALRNRHAQRATWDLVEARWEEITRKYPPAMLQALVSPLATVMDEPLAERMTAWLDAHPIPELVRPLAQAKELQSIHRALAGRLRGRLASWLAAAPHSGPDGRPGLSTDGPGSPRT